MTRRDRNDDRLPPATEAPPTPPLPDGTPTGPAGHLHPCGCVAPSVNTLTLGNYERGRADERRRSREVLADPDSEWRFTGPALAYFADLMGDER